MNLSGEEYNPDFNDIILQKDVINTFLGIKLNYDTIAIKPRKQHYEPNEEVKKVYNELYQTMKNLVKSV